MGLGQDGRREGFQLSSRADFFEVEVGLETTLKRPIINTRDEPHADPALWRRLHVIVGDANLSETATLLKLGTTAIVLSMIEAGGPNLGIELANPVAAMHRVSHDLSLAAPLECLRRSPLTALEIQQAYLEAARVHCAGQPGGTDPRTAEVLDLWAEVLAGLAAEPRALADRLDWVAKLALLDGLPAPRRAGLVGSASGGHRPAVRRHPRGEGPGLPARAARIPASDHHRRRGRSRRRRTRPPTPEPGSGASASDGSGIGSLPPRGTRSSSTSPGVPSLVRVPTPDPHAGHPGARRGPHGLRRRGGCAGRGARGALTPIARRATATRAGWACGARRSALVSVVTR